MLRAFAVKDPLPQILSPRRIMSCSPDVLFSCSVDPDRYFSSPISSLTPVVRSPGRRRRHAPCIPPDVVIIDPASGDPLFLRDSIPSSNVYKIACCRRFHMETGFYNHGDAPPGLSRWTVVPEFLG